LSRASAAGQTRSWFSHGTPLPDSIPEGHCHSQVRWALPAVATHSVRPRARGLTFRSASDMPLSSVFALGASTESWALFPSRTPLPVTNLSLAPVRSPVDDAWLSGRRSWPHRQPRT
jgi:hypothetical protein